MKFNFIVGIVATVALFVPVLLVVTGRFFTKCSLLALAVNYLFTALSNVMSLELIRVSPGALHWFSAVCNYLDAPLMLLSLLFFCRTKKQKQVVIIALAVTLAYELVIALLYGTSPQCSMYVLGLGTPLVLGYTIYFFLHYGKVSIVQGKGLGKTMMLVGNLFSYGCFAVIYYLYYLAHTTAVADVMLMYHILTLISAVFMSMGLVWLVRRAREMKEVQLTRKELALFFEN